MVFVLSPGILVLYFFVNELMKFSVEWSSEELIFENSPSAHTHSFSVFPSNILINRQRKVKALALRTAGKDWDSQWGVTFKDKKTLPPNSEKFFSEGLEHAIMRAITVAWAAVILILSDPLRLLPRERRETAAIEKTQSIESRRSEIYLWLYPFLAVTMWVSC